MSRIIKDFVTICLFALMFMHLGSAFAQDGDQCLAKTDDENFAEARQMASRRNYGEARDVLHVILNRNPEYHDARVLLARTYGWDGRADEARRELKIVLSKSTYHEDALHALSDIEMWDSRFAEALLIVNVSLKKYADSEEFLFKRARILSALKREDEALQTVNQLLKINPSHQQGLDWLAGYKVRQMKNTVGLVYALDIYSKGSALAHYASVLLERKSSWGSSTFRFNYANRFDKDGLQAEIDVYPRISQTMYAYVNYGYSGTWLFPKHRMGAEIFASLPHDLEISGGLRYLSFDGESGVTIYTGSVGWYYKNYWFSGRPYISVDQNNETSSSVTLHIRRYFASKDDYIGINTGFGFSPDERRWQSGSGFTNERIYILQSQRAGIVWMKTLSHAYLFRASADMVRQEFLSDQSEYMLITSLTVGIRKRF